MTSPLEELLTLYGKGDFSSRGMRTLMGVFGLAHEWHRYQLNDLNEDELIAIIRRTETTWTPPKVRR